MTRPGSRPDARRRRPRWRGGGRQAGNCARWPCSGAARARREDQARRRHRIARPAAQKLLLHGHCARARCLGARSSSDDGSLTTGPPHRRRRLALGGRRPFDLLPRPCPPKEPSPIPPPPPPLPPPPLPPLPPLPLPTTSTATRRRAAPRRARAGDGRWVSAAVKHEAPMNHGPWPISRGRA